VSGSVAPARLHGRESRPVFGWCAPHCILGIVSKQHGIAGLEVDLPHLVGALRVVSEHLTCPPPRWRRPYVFRRFCASWARETRGDKCYIL